jgi:outer membrane protein assembly factor BamA
MFLEGLMRRLFGCCFLFLFFVSNAAQVMPIRRHVEVACDTQEPEQNLPELVTGEAVLEYVDVRSDISFDLAYIRYLTGLFDGAVVTQEVLAKAVFYLKHLKQYSSVIIDSQQQGSALRLVMELVGQWRIGAVSCQGVWFGKNSLKQLYDGRQGDVFCEKRHEASLQKMQSIISAQGYRDGKVQAKLKKNDVEKIIDIDLIVDYGQRYTVSAVTIEAAQNQDLSPGQQQILLRAKKQFGSMISKKKYEESLISDFESRLKTYCADNGYPFVELRKKEVVDSFNRRIGLSWDIIFNNKRMCLFIGNSIMADHVLRDYIMRGADSLWAISSQLCVKELQNFYRQKGFLSATVDLLEEADLWKFFIKEGDRTFVEGLAFDGVQSIDRSIAKKCFTRIVRRPYDEEICKNACKRLELLYVEQGFWDVRVETSYRVLLEDSRKCIVQVSVVEGPRRYISTVKLSGYSKLLYRGPFLRFASLEKPIPFKLSFLQEQRQWLLEYFQRKGCKVIEIKPQFDGPYDNMSLVWDISVGQSKTTFGKPIIRGTSTISRDKIAREIAFQEGEAWEKKKVEDTFDNLSRLGVFDSVRIYPLTKPDGQGQQPVVVDLCETDPYEARFRFGFETIGKNALFRNGVTHKIGGSLLCKNVTGRVDQMCINFDMTRYNQLAEVVYTLPWLSDWPVTFQAKLYKNKINKPVFNGAQQTLYRARQDGLLCRFSSDKLFGSCSCNVGCEMIEIDNVAHSLAKAIDFEPSLMFRKLPYFFVEPSLLYSSLDDDVYPKNGFSSMLSCKAMLAFYRQANSYFKVVGEQSVYQSFGYLTLALRLRAGHIFVNNFYELPPNERFYLGGPQSIRCFAPDFAPPISFMEDEGRLLAFPQGGKTFCNINIEARFPLTRYVTAVVFHDIGLLSKPSALNVLSNSGYRRGYQFQEPSVHQIKWLGAIGVGLRYNTSMGPIRFDVGYNIHRASDHDPSFMWYLTLGQVF